VKALLLLLAFGAFDPSALSVEELFRISSSPLLADQPRVEPCRDELVRRGPPAVELLVGHVGTEMPRERITLEETLPGMGRPAEKALLWLLGREDEPRALGQILTLLGLMGSDGAMPRLRPLEEHPDWKVRRAVASYLGGLPAGRGAGPLLRLLRDPAGEVRKEAALALGSRKEEGSAGALVLLLDDPFHGARFASARALAATGPVGQETLSALLRDPGASWLARAHALEVSTDRKAIRPYLEDRDWALRGFAAEALRRLGDLRYLDAHTQRERHPFVLGKRRHLK
jgi:HEAT repeat protein